MVMLKNLETLLQIFRRRNDAREGIAAKTFLNPIVTSESADLILRLTIKLTLCTPALLCVAATPRHAEDARTTPEGRVHDMIIRALANRTKNLQIRGKLRVMDRDRRQLSIPRLHFAGVLYVAVYLKQQTAPERMWFVFFFIQ